MISLLTMIWSPQKFTLSPNVVFKRYDQKHLFSLVSLWRENESKILVFYEKCQIIITIDFQFHHQNMGNNFCLDNAHKSVELQRFHESSSMTISRNSRTSSILTRMQQTNQIYQKLKSQKPLQVSIQSLKDKYDPFRMVLYGEDCQYVGETQAGKPHGPGQVYFSNGSFLEAEFKNGEIDCEDALMIEGNGNYYRGGFKESAQTGMGVLRSSGSEWRGNFLSGRLTGIGQLYFEDGKIYKGQFSNGKMNGKGTLTYKNGDVFEGYFKEGQRSGLGFFKTSKYEYYGPFADDMKEGKGTLIMQSGDKFEGWFQRDRLNGYGELHRKTGQIWKKKYQEEQIQKIMI